MKIDQFDVVIVGSGPAGAHAAYPLVKAGLQVAIIDGGLDSKRKDQNSIDFSSNKSTAAGHAYDLLKESSYVFNKTYQLLKIQSKIEIIQSLAKGGLSEIWDGICDFFLPSELERIGMSVGEIQKEYKDVAKRIKLKYRLPLEFHSRLILQAAKNKQSKESIVYKLPSAATYYSRLSIDELKKFRNFTYIPNQLVYNVRDTEKFVEIQSYFIDSNVKNVVRANFLILAAGSINTTRILMRSLNLFNYKASFLTKAHYIIVCLHLRTVFKKKNIKQLKIGQIGISSREIHNGVSAFFIQLYRFNTLAIEKALEYIPLPKIITSKLFAIIAPSLMIADVRFPAFESKSKWCKLKKVNNGKDVLIISFQESKEEVEGHRSQLKVITQKLRTLGLFSIKTVDDYVTAHYGGGVPFQDTPGKLSVDKNSKLHQANRIYVADSSSWRALPAKSPTLTIMANASRVGKNVLKQFKKVV